MSFSDRVDRLQRRYPVLGFPVAVGYKFFDDLGGYLAALLTYYIFLSIVPVLLLASTVLSWVLRGHPDWQQRLLDSTLGEFPVIGDQLKVPAALDGGLGAVVVGVLGALYGALGAAQALQYASNTVWQVPRNSRPNPFAARGRSVTLLTTTGVGLLVTTAASIGLQRVLPGTYGALAVHLVSVVMSTGVVIAAYRMATARALTVADVWVGALVTAVGWEILKTYGAAYVDSVIRHASAINGVFAFVLGMLAFIYLAALLVVTAQEIDVVRRRHLYPRALLTPFTDDVDLTAGDEQAYAGQAKATRAKAFEQISVSFSDRPETAPPDEATLREGDTAELPTRSGPRGEEPDSRP